MATLAVAPVRFDLQIAVVVVLKEQSAVQEVVQQADLLDLLRQ